MSTLALRFKNPPVRTVELSLYFDQVELKLTRIFPLIAALQENFPEAREEFAHLPWTIEAQDFDYPNFLPEGAENFPFPFFTFADNEGRSVSFQDDRVVLRWEFDSSREYPGYEELIASLKTTFLKFESHATLPPSGKIQVRRVRAEYSNDTDSNIPWTVSQQVFSPTDPHVEANPIPELQGTNAGGLFHFDSDTLIAHVDFAAISNVSINTLSLRSTVHSSKSDEADSEEALDWIDALNFAHDRLIYCFSQLTTDDQQNSWGRYDTSK